MKVVLTYVNGSDLESSVRIIGFETESIDKLEYAICQMAQSYMDALPEIEKNIAKIYKNRKLSVEAQERKVDELRREPYMLRSGRYQLWVGEFITYTFNGDSMIKEFIMPEILELEKWFEAVTEKCIGLH